MDERSARYRYKQLGAPDVQIREERIWKSRANLGKLGERPAWRRCSCAPLHFSLQADRAVRTCILSSSVVQYTSYIVSSRD